MEDAVRIVAELVNRKAQLEQENERLRCTMVDTERFHNVPMSLDVAGQLHGVSAKVLRRLVDLGLIAKHPKSSDSKILIRASEAIRMDIDVLREQAKHLSYV
jgi:hypothetical protein